MFVDNWAVARWPLTVGWSLVVKGKKEKMPTVRVIDSATGKMQQ